MSARSRRFGVIASVVLGAVAVLALTAQISGFPSRPRFQAIGVAATPSATPGTITGDDPDGLTLQTSDGAQLILATLSAGAGAEFQLPNAASQLTAARGATIFELPLVHAEISAPSAADLLPGDFIIIGKTADTARASDTTFTDDPDLQVTGLPAGHYAIELYLSATEGGGGFKWSLDAPGAGADARIQGVRYCAATAATVFVDENTNTTCAAGNTTYFFVGSGSTDDTVGGAGIFTIEWGQVTSNATNTVLESESWLKLTRLK